jgi:PAS domain S-box-containing protein
MDAPLPDDHQNLIRTLRERTKELDCIYAISDMAANPSSPLEKIIQDITDRVPPGFQHPEHTCARVTVHNRVTKTANFKGCRLKLEAPITVHDKVAGRLEVGYLVPLPPRHSPFLEEEKKLVQAIAARIGMVLHGKALQEALEESDKKYRALVENSLTGIFQTTLDGRFVYANDVCLKMLEYDSFAELEKINAASLYRDLEKRTALLNMVKRHKKISNFELELLTRTGRPLSVLVTVSLKGTILTGMAMDVTERKGIEEELRAKSLSLEETNTALRVILQQAQRGIDDIQTTLLSNVKQLVLPYVKQLHATALHANQKTLLAIIETNLHSMLSPFLKNLFNVHGGFTPAEIKIAALMREGNTVKEIAAALGVSPSSVNLHRQNIRNKLGLARKKVSLRTYLQSLLK